MFLLAEIAISGYVLEWGRLVELQACMILLCVCLCVAFVVLGVCVLAVVSSSSVVFLEAAAWPFPIFSYV